jgi:hypothetical protein
LEPGTEEYVIVFWERVTDLKILDPAMGSGHFLTKATGYLAEAVMEQVRELETSSLFDEEQVRREISRECIYGVDVNGMAVELAKLSMWLETLAADQPLAFLDHHLKTGNSLVGSDITEVLAEEDEPGQVTLAYDFAQTRQRALGHVMDRMGELLAIDNESLKDVKSMEEIYADIRADPLYGRLRAMATVHTASQFGLDVPGDADERMARAIEDEDDWADIEVTDWFRAARAMADDEGFFHWELEFPEVFFDMDGERMSSAGFDAVVGNPPWVITADTELREYLWEQYEYQSGQPDLYRFFVERCLSMTGGRFGMITPSSWFRIPAATQLRKNTIKNYGLASISLVPQTAFEGVDANMATFIVSANTSVGEIVIRNLDESGSTNQLSMISHENISHDDYRIPLQFGGESERQIVSKMREQSFQLGEIADTTVGYQLYHTDIHTERQIENEVLRAP